MSIVLKIKTHITEDNRGMVQFFFASGEDQTFQLAGELNLHIGESQLLGAALLLGAERMRGHLVVECVPQETLLGEHEVGRLTSQEPNLRPASSLEGPDTERAHQEHAAWHALCETLLTQGVVTEQDLDASLYGHETLGQRLLLAVREWGDKLAELRKSRKLG